MAPQLLDPLLPEDTVAVRAPVLEKGDEAEGKGALLELAFRESAGVEDA